MHAIKRCVNRDRNDKNVSELTHAISNSGNGAGRPAAPAVVGAKEGVCFAWQKKSKCDKPNCEWKRNKVMRPREGAAETTKKTTKVRMNAMTSETNPRETILVGESLHLETRAKATVTRVLVHLANHVCSMRGPQMNKEL